IIDSANKGCPSLEGGSIKVPMSQRTNPGGFDVDVCEAAIPFGTSFRVEGTTVKLPVAKMNPTNVLIIGDTGCRETDCREAAPAWPFDEIAAAAAQLEPDVVVHAGDFIYRTAKSTLTIDGQPLTVYQAGDGSDPRCQLDSPYVSQNAAYSEFPDSWEGWQED